MILDTQSGDFSLASIIRLDKRPAKDIIQVGYGAITIESYKSNYTVVTAGDGLPALDHLRRQSFDLIITDFSMPEMNGCELARIVRRRWLNTPILLMTANRTILSEKTDEIRGLDGFIDKPFSLTQMLELVDRLVEQAGQSKISTGSKLSRQTPAR